MTTQSSWSGETVARQAAAVEGSRFSHRGGRGSHRGMPQATGETAVLLDANNQAGPGPNHLGGLCQLLHRGQHRPGQRRGASTASRTCPTRTSRRTRPVRRPAHEGGVLAGLHLQRRIELVKKRRGGDSDCHCVHTCLASLKKKKTTPSSTLHARLS